MNTEVTVSNNDDNFINLEIISYSNGIDINFDESDEAALVVHDNNLEAHSNIISSISDDIDDINIALTDVNTLLATKSNISTTYTKTEVDNSLSTKLSSTDNTVTKQGNSFNAASQLVKLNSSSQLPAVDGSLLTNISLPIDSCISFGTVSSGTIILTKDKFHTVTFSGASTIALPSGLTNGVHYNCSLLITMASVVTITQPTVVWANGVTPALTSTTAKYRLTYETLNGGTTWYAYYTVLGA